MTKPKYDVGQMVRVVSNPDPDIEAKQAMVGRICEVRLNRCLGGNSYAVYDANKTDYWYFREQDLAPVEKTLYDLEVGDVVVSDGGEFKIGAVIGEIIIAIHKNGYATIPYTAKELKDAGFTLKQPEQPKEAKEMTVSDISKELGYEVKIIKEEK